MPSELTLRLRVDPVTGRREVVVDYASDADALPIEHEDEHRRLAGKVVEGGLNSGKVEVTRAQEEPAAQQPAGEQPVADGVKSQR
ncbi:MAG TPA: hypothetical protein VFQ53_06150 [Kofleriaceae bacterium]|nr:hypothetical protein [Kofleriaceae bacterium]